MASAYPVNNRLTLIPCRSKFISRQTLLSNFMNLLNISDVSSRNWTDKLPFTDTDVTAGTENELQAAVAGQRNHIDLAQAIESSSYFKNIIKRVASGDAPRKILASLDNYLSSSSHIWENSWVRLPLNTLNAYAESVLETDLLADKRRNNGSRRSDSRRFFIHCRSKDFLRIPTSYLLKLSLAQAIGQPGVPDHIRLTGEKMQNHFLNDNTSPETTSFFPVTCDREDGLGKSVISEMLLRYLLTQLLVQYADHRFELKKNGQQAMVYFAPHPPLRQKQLNDLIPDAFYRELFMSPCLSGWEQGEAKHQYMRLCHEVLSRSQLNTLAKLKEAGIIANNLVVLPRTSNISLANNGIHLSFGSRKLSQLMSNENSDFGPFEEKYFGDLIIKISEHFLPLFVGTYSAAPYRLDFQDFHPEKVLGFLPHELDYTHLRMIWRCWKQKAKIKRFSHPFTPFGPVWFDRAISKFFRLKGDLVNDFRLIDYMVSLLSTDESPALNGRLGNDIRLKADLSDMGIFDQRMPLYMLLRPRHFKSMGFTGFEGRHYSLFKGFEQDMKPAVELQQLITIMAYKYILKENVTHADIPDSPTVESERRQFFFGAAIGLPYLYVHQSTRNRMMQRILSYCHNAQYSRHYKGYICVPTVEYQRALIRLLKTEGRDLIEMVHLGPELEDLEQRINDPKTFAASHRLVRSISGKNKPAIHQSSLEFNQAAESYYQNQLRMDHMKEAYAYFRESVHELDSWQSWRSGQYNQELLTLLNGKNADDFLMAAKQNVLSDSLSPKICQKLICLLLLVLYHQKRKNTWS